MTDSSASTSSNGGSKKPETINGGGNDGGGGGPAGGNGSVAGTPKNRLPKRGSASPPITEQQSLPHQQQQQQYSQQYPHKRSNSADLTQAFQQSQRQQQMMMMMQQHGGGSSSGSLGAASNGSYGYGPNNMYSAGGGVVPPPPPPHGYYYAYGAPVPTYNPMMTQSQQLPDYAMPPSDGPSGSRARSWSGDPSMFDRQQQAQWIAAMQQQQHQQQQQQNRSPFASDPGYGFPQQYGSSQVPTGTPRSSRHRRSNSASSTGSGGGAPFSPRSEFMKLANVAPSGSGGNSPRNSSRGGQTPQPQYGSYSSNAGMAAYAPHLQVPMTMAPPPPPPQAYETVYDSFESGGGGSMPSPYISPEKARGGRTSPFMTPDKMYNANNNNNNNMSTNSLGSAGGEAVFLARAARGMASGSHSGPSSTRKRHMRQKSVQLFMQDVKGIEQPPACRDVFFLLFFVFHLFGMVLLSNMYSYEALQHGEQTIVPDQSPSDGEHARGFTVNYNNLLIIAGCCGVEAMVLSTTLLGVMSYFARNFVQVALIVAIALSFVWGTLGIGLSPQNLVPITGIVALALSVAYAIVVWDRVPFSTANLLTALSAMRAYPGTVVMTLVSQFLGLGWSIYYAVICCGVYDAIQDGRIAVSQKVQVIISILLGISYYWTINVFLNAVQVATAAVVGQWWYQPAENQTVRKSSFKTIFYSMGSICYGSLFVGPVKMLRQLSVLFRPSSDETSLLLFHECLRCIQTCITGFVEGIVERFNPWGFAYVGLYSYSFTEASSLATELFAKRGWTTIVSDDLVSNVLLMTSVVVGGVTGCFGFLLSGMENLHATSLETPGVVSFFLGLVLGLVLTSILFGAINGSVNAVIILFATSPVDFERHHQSLSREMRSAWREVWPGAVDDVDVRLAMAGANGSHHGGLMVGSSPRLGPVSSGVVPPPPPMVPEYAQIGERTPLMNDHKK